MCPAAARQSSFCAPITRCKAGLGATATDEPRAPPHASVPKENPKKKARQELFAGRFPKSDRLSVKNDTCPLQERHLSAPVRFLASAALPTPLRDQDNLRHGAPRAAVRDEGRPARTARPARTTRPTHARRFHGPALKASNIMRLLDFVCFWTKCGHTLGTRLTLHCRDCFDLVSKYLLALKTHPRVGCALWNIDIELRSGWYVSE